MPSITDRDRADEAVGSPGPFLGTVENAITAFAGGGQASARQLTAKFNRVTVVATAADSVKLPKALPGAELFVHNADSTDSMNVFPTSGDAINALSPDAAYAMAAGVKAQFFCCVAGIWSAIFSA